MARVGCHREDHERDGEMRKKKIRILLNTQRMRKKVQAQLSDVEEVGLENGVSWVQT